VTRTTGRYARLQRLNVAVGVVLLGQAVFMLLTTNDLSLPVTAAWLDDDPVVARRPVPEDVFTVPIGATVAIFLLLAAVDHLLVAAPGARPWYERHLERGVNYARWLEYSVSASVMLVLIGLFVGIRDLAAVVALFAANTAMILFGLLMERHQRPGQADWSAFWFGSLVGAVPWLLIGAYALQPPTVPGFVYAVVVLQLLLFFSFAANMALQYARVGPWQDYLHGEVTYLVLSLTAKSLLAWLVYANVLRT